MRAVRSLLSLLCVIACCPCCFPCYICAFRNHKRRARRLGEPDEWLGPRSPVDVHPLASRKRRLSLSSGSGPPCLDSDQKVNMQEQALIFQKLPPEIRAQIWQEVVGGYKIYLGIVAQKLRHCKIFGGLGIARDSIDEDEQERLQIEHRLLPLLFTCRRVYTEAVPHLYSANKFTISHIDAVLALTSSIRLPRFNSISSMSITWSLLMTHRLGFTFGMRTQDAQLWDKASRMIASMKGLKNMDIILWGGGMPYGPMGQWDGIKELLDMLCRITRPTKYVVTIDETEVEDLMTVYKDAPFRLKWGYEPGEVLM